MTTWILLRGLTRERGHWGDFPERLATAFPGATIVAPDLAGNGERYRLASPTRVAAMTTDLREQLRQRALAPPYRLLAMSLGAMVAADWAASLPDEIAACVLINTSLRPFSPIHHRLRPRAYPALLRLAFLGCNAERREREILGLTSRLGRPDSDESPAVTASRASIIDDWASLRRAHPVSTGNACRQLLAAARYRAPLHAPAVPMLILNSRQDRLVDASCSRKIAHRWRAAFAEHPAAGHDLPLDDAPWVIRQIDDWLRTLDTLP